MRRKRYRFRGIPSPPFDGGADRDLTAPYRRFKAEDAGSETGKNSADKEETVRVHFTGDIPVNSEY